MAKNDVVLVDAIIERAQIESPDKDVGELFEYFVFSQILKNYDLSPDEINLGWTDGTHDGGIDGFYVLVNGRLLTDVSDFAWPRSSAEIHVYLITCKHHETFQQATFDAMLPTLQEVFDLSKSDAELSGKYSETLLKCRATFIAAFRHLSLTRPSLHFTIIYASRGDSNSLGESVAARGTQIAALFTSYFSACTATLKMLGAAELVELHRQVKSFALDLPILECLTAGDEGYVVLTKLTDYCIFVRDDENHLRRYLFDSNVRAYLGANAVNADIAASLADKSAPNFWWLNNGVTILATSASLVGKTLKLRDIQIVNGLQTTESIHNHFRAAGLRSGDLRALLVKVIITTDEGVHDRVIRATNNQSAVEPAALHATEKIQRDIEEILLRHEWFYERRINYYRNEGRPENRILSPLTVASGSVALLLKNPARASKLRQRHLRSPENYAAIFSQQHLARAWPVVAALIRAAENAIARSQKANAGSRAQRVAAWRGLLAYVAVVRALKTFEYDHRALADMDVSQITDGYMDECLARVASVPGSPGAKKISELRVQQICGAIADHWGIKGDSLRGRRPLPLLMRKRQTGVLYRDSDEFLLAVEALLPPQPWKPGVHAEVGRRLGASPRRVSGAIQELIRLGKRYHQRDGVVYDEAGRELFRDESRSSKGPG